MQPRVTYWTGVWHPTREAISKEVDLLRRRSGGLRPVVSFATGQQCEWLVHDRIIKLGGSQHALLHLMTATVERRGDVTHAFGAVSGWHMLRFLGRRPIVYTAALPGLALDRSLYEKVTVFAAESEPIAGTLVSAGVPAHKVEVIYPGIDLSAFVPAPAPSPGRFRVLFASTPAHVDEFEARGIPLMAEVARRAPDVEIVLLWRNWGDRASARRALWTLDLPANLIVEMRDAPDMVDQYQRAHATICCYAAGFGKSCPNSVVEGLACGRPTILTDTVGTAGLIARHGAGAVVPRHVDGVLSAIRALEQDYDAFSRRARALAESHFGLDVFMNRYDELYERALGARPRVTNPAKLRTQPCGRVGSEAGIPRSPC